MLILPIAIILVGCGNDTEASTTNLSSSASSSSTQSEKTAYTGEKGTKVVIKDKQIILSESDFSGTTANFYNTVLSGKTVYFFVVRDKNGVFRAAANACQVCAESMQGFKQKGNNMVCNTCGNSYPLEKIATEKGGCNPVPINPNLDVEGGNITVTQTDLNNILNFF